MTRLRPFAIVALIATTLALPTLSWAKPPPVHSIWAKKQNLVVDMGVPHIPVYSDAIVSWQDYLGPAFAHARAYTASGDYYEFTLVKVSGYPGYDQIDGYWDVTLNWSPLCTACKGVAVNLSQPVGGAFKISVDGGNYGFSGIITERYDY